MPDDKTPFVNPESVQATNLQPDAPGSVPGFPPAVDAMFGPELESVDLAGSSTSVDSSQSEEAPTHAPPLARRPPTPVPPRGVGAGRQGRAENERGVQSHFPPVLDGSSSLQARWLAAQSAAPAQLVPPDSPDWREQLSAAPRPARPAGARPARPGGLDSGAGVPADSPLSLPSLPRRSGGRAAHVAPGADATSPPSPSAATGARTRGGLSGPA